MPEKRFTPNDFIDPQTLPSGARPFRKGEFIDNLDGTHSTERSMSINIEGKEVLVPSLWMTEKGPIDLSRNPDTLSRAVREFEEKTGKKFPRFDSPEEATRFSKSRSSSGGVFSGPAAR